MIVGYAPVRKNTRTMPKECEQRERERNREDAGYRESGGSVEEMARTWLEKRSNVHLFLAHFILTRESSELQTQQ